VKHPVYKNSQTVSEFKYLRTVLMNRKEVSVKIRRLINSEKFCCSVLSLILSTFPVVEHQDNNGFVSFVVMVDSLVSCLGGEKT
jgi:hypothetical protein